jgi:erythronate-4-phosphate dehydrogenase
LSFVVTSFRIVADENIPCVENAFGDFGTIERRPGRDIGAEAVAEADVLLVRSVTPVTASLLNESPVQFVGSATIGTDHVDEAYLREQGIAFAHAPASNADSVADYVVAALLCLAHRRGVSLRNRTVGVVGCGNIGGRLLRRLPALGLRVLPHDPPRAAAESGPQGPDFVSMDTVLDRADILTLHVPLTTDAPHPTRRLVDGAVLDRLGPDAWLLNTARGPVVDGDALLGALRRDRLGAAVLDVWEEEPTPDPSLVHAVDFATPHIAGYARDGKVRGTTMLYEAFCEHVGRDPTWSPAAALRPEHPASLRCAPPDPRLSRVDWLHHLVRQAYDLDADDARMRGLLDRPRDEQGAYFQRLRATYPTRRELRCFSVPAAGVPARHRTAVTDGLTMQPCAPGRYGNRIVAS